MTLPDFVVAGTVRSGTTGLFRHLEDHPGVHVAAVKEVHFFDDHYDEGVDWYASHFAEARGRVVGDVTPNYAFSEEAVSRMAALLPDARVIILFRNPADRAYSQFWMQRSYGNERLSFEEALAVEADRLGRGDETVRRRFGYRERSRYIDQWERLARHYPRDQLLPVTHEALTDRNSGAFQGICAFLGVEQLPPSASGRANTYRSFRSLAVRQATKRIYRYGPGGRTLAMALARANTRSTTYPPMNPSTRAQFASDMIAHNKALAEATGLDLSSWAD